MVGAEFTHEGDASKQACKNVFGKSEDTKKLENI
jgi:hypothetical protein